MNAARAQRRAERGIFLGRRIDADHPVDPGIARGIGEPCRPAPQHRIGIAHQHQRHIRVPRTEIARDRQDIGGGGARAEAAQIGGLNRGAVGHRIGERHPQLDHIGAPRHERVEDRRGRRRVRIARGDETYQRRAILGKGFGKAGHISTPSASATVKISLSPRPETLTRIIASLA